MCIGGGLQQRCPATKLVDLRGPLGAKLEQQRVAQFNRDVRNAKLLAEVALTLGTLGSGTVIKLKAA